MFFAISLQFYLCMATRIVICLGCSREFSVEQLEEDGRVVSVLVLSRKGSIFTNWCKYNVLYPCALDVRLSKRQYHL
jgi:hypothetical protein